MGYFEIGIFQPRRTDNLGTLWRTAYQLGAAGIFTIGRQYRRQASDTSVTELHIPLRAYATFEDFLAARPKGALLVGIEFGGEPLSQFHHPERAIYLLGSENNGLPPRILEQCNHVVSIEAIGKPSYNVAVAGALVMYHRQFGSTRA